jgi:hypothetical protein
MTHGTPRRLGLGTFTRLTLLAGYCGAVCAIGACGIGSERRAEPDGNADTETTDGSAPASDVRIATLAMANDLGENSAAAASVDQPGILFGVNDSGHEPELFAFDTTGADRGRWRIVGAINRDWEAVAVGRCVPGGGAWCVYIGDVGDNALRRPLISIYRVAEPAPLAGGERGELRADVLIARYPDGAHNVEGMVVAPDGSLHLFTKELRRSGRTAPAATRVYELAPRLWGGATPAEATLVDSLPIAPDARDRHAVTDAALSRNGAVLVVRTPARLFTFSLDPTSGRLRPDRAPAICDLSPLAEEQGEGVGILAVDAASARLALTSEGKRQPLRLVSCPIPPR